MLQLRLLPLRPQRRAGGRHIQLQGMGRAQRQEGYPGRQVREEGEGRLREQPQGILPFPIGHIHVRVRLRPVLRLAGHPGQGGPLPGDFLQDQTQMSPVQDSHEGAGPFPARHLMPQVRRHHGARPPQPCEMARFTRSGSACRWTRGPFPRRSPPPAPSRSSRLSSPRCG